MQECVEPPAFIPDHLWSLGEKRWRCKVLASMALPGMGLEIEDCFLEKGAEYLEKHATGC